jgi:translocation and assembly module TamA
MTVRRLLCALALAGAAVPAPGAEIRVEGLEGPELANVEARLQILAYAREGGREAAQLRRLHREAEDDIREALQAYGYYAPTVRASVRGQPPDWNVRYRVETGPPTLLERVDLRVEAPGRGTPPELYEVLKASTLREGERLLHEQYEEVKTALGRAAYQGGFLDARFTTQVLRVDVQRHRAEAILVLETGPRYYFGEVRVAQEGLDPEFIERYVPIEPGAPFSPEKLLQAQFALSDLGYFSTVEVQPQKDQAVDRHIPVVIATTPRPPRRYDIGVGYGTDTGARLTLGTEFRQLTRTGHKVRSELRLSEIKNSIGADYRIPLGTRAGENLGFATAYTDEEVGDGQSERYEFTLSLSRTPGSWQRQVYLKHQYEESFVPATGTDSTKLLMPGLSLLRGELDDPIHAREGYSLFFDVHGGHEAVVSDVNFMQSKVLLRIVLPFLERGRLLGRAEFGANILDEFRELPASQRFFAGGDQSVRGYRYQSLGPADATGQVVGGRYLSTYSIEAEYRVWHNWGAAAFFDLGNAGNDPSPRLFRGVGAGVRYRAPVGTLQLDLAHPMDSNDRGGVRPHLGIRVGL